MKFIRDIISEKANLAGRAGRELPEADMVQNTPPDVVDGPGLADEFAADSMNADVDIIHKVASGGQSLSGTPDYAFATDEPAETDTDVAISAASESDLLPALDDAGIDDDEDDASELFGDLWSEPADAPDHPVDEKPESSENDPAAPIWASDPATKADHRSETETGTKAEAEAEVELEEKPFSAPAAPPVRPATRAIMPDMPPMQPAAAPSPAPEDSSPFQRMVRRDRSLPSDMPPRRAQPASKVTSEMPREMPAEILAETPVELPKTIKVPAPAAGRAARQAGRVKTRLLGFNTEQDTAPDPFAAQPAQVPAATAPATPTMYPVGWMVVTDGPGRGNAFTLFDGVSQIGRGDDQAIRLDFGDNSISRSSHAAIAYDDEQQAFFLGHGGKANLVRLNGNPVLSTEQIDSGAMIRIGETTLRFVALCGNQFDWGSCQDDDTENAQFG